MGYFIEYRSSKEFDNYKKISNVIREAFVIGDKTIWAIVTNVNLDNGATLVRTYVLEGYDKIYCIPIEEISDRYKIKRSEKEKSMLLTKEKEFVDEITDERDSYSDDSLFNITSFGTDMTFRELITMYEEGDLEKPEMQRNYVWNKNEASRFIDSVLLGLPVPSIFLAKTKDEKRLIVDGYQRIMTVYDYVHRGVFGGDEKSFSLSNSDIINVRWRGKTFQELLPEEKRKIRNFPIHAIVFEQKEPLDDTGMYQIFERINTSGRTLKPQEIRNCVYHGSFNKLLIELNKNQIWRQLFNNDKPDSRMTDIELILRMFAFGYIGKQDEIKQKQINLVQYLNLFMKRNDDFEVVSKESLINNFETIMNIFSNNFNINLFRNGKLKEGKINYSNKINPAIVDSVFAATLFYVLNNKLIEFDNVNFMDRYDELILNTEYQDAISKRTTNIDRIKKRIELATNILYRVDYGW